MNYANVLRVVFNTPWAILPETYRAICQVARRRCIEGTRLEPEEIRRAIGTREQRVAGRPTIFRPTLAGKREDEDDDAPRGPQPYVIDTRGAKLPAGGVGGGGGRGGIAVLPLYGIIGYRANLLEDSSSGIGTSTEIFSAWFAGAVQDPGIAAVVLDIDSPGGSVEGLPELADQIFSARGGKPVIAIANAMAASAAYWIATAADSLWVTPSGMVGSVGTVMEHVDLSELERARGIKTTFIHAGEFKVEGNSSEPLGDAARAEFQRVVDAYYRQFVSGVARNRGTSAAAVVSGFKSGRMALAGEAVQLGMADRVGTMLELLASLGLGASGQLSGVSGQPRSHASVDVRRKRAALQQ